MVATTGTFDGRTWHLALSLQTLYGQTIDRWPLRGAALERDGSIGDTVHQAQGVPSFDARTGYPTGGTDHLPDAYNIVCALDVGYDPTRPDYFDALAYARLVAHDPRVAYVMAENVVPGRKIQFGGHSDPQCNGVDIGPSTAGPHVHTSVLHVPRSADATTAWGIAPPPPAPPPPPPTITGEPMATRVQEQNPGPTGPVYLATESFLVGLANSGEGAAVAKTFPHAPMVGLTPQELADLKAVYARAGALHG